MRKRRHIPSGFTILELLIATGVIAIAGGFVFLILDTGLKLYAKNTCINLTHDQARTAYLQLMGDVHIGASPIVCSGTPGQAVSFQVLRGGPFMVNSNVSYSNPNSIILRIPSAANFKPQVGEILIIPAYEVQADITGVSISGTLATLTLSGSGSTIALNGTGVTTGIPPTSASGTWLTTSTGSYSYNVGCYITDRVTYLISGTPSGSTLGTWFSNVYPTSSGSTNLTYAAAVGSGSNELLYFYHNLTTGSLTKIRVSQNLINPTDLKAPATPFLANNTTLIINNIATADLLHYGTIVTGTNMLINGTSLTGTAIVFSRGMNSLGVNMCLTGGTLSIRNQITTLP